MPAAKHLDPLLGIDIHMIQPPITCPPIPIPHPHIGMVLDPFDYVPILGATVTVAGLKRAQAGTAGIAIPHFPIGGTFIKPPANESEMFMGSATVSVDADAFSYLGLPALSCHCIGMPAPPRPKGAPPKSLVLPTTVVLSIPIGVTVGGPPTISLMALGMRVGMAALGKAFKKLRKLQKSSKRMKAISDRIHRAASKVMDDLGVPPNVQNRIHRSICTATGHPVDVATGKMFTEFDDFEIPGALPFRWSRVWMSCSSYEGPLGHGWHHSYDYALAVDWERRCIAVRLDDGRAAVFPTLELGEQAFDLGERMTLIRDEHGYILRTPSRVRLRFASLSAHDGQLRPTEIHDEFGAHLQLAWTGGRLRSVTDSAGRMFEVQSDAEGRIVAIVGPDPDHPSARMPLVTYEYDAHGDLVATTDACGARARFVYRDHLLVRETDRNGLSFHFEYETIAGAARCVRTWGDEDIFVRTLEYEVAEGRTIETDGEGHRTIHQHDGVLVKATTDPLGHRTSFEHDEWGRLTRRTDPLGASTSFTHDSRGNLVEQVGSDGSQITLGYDDSDRLVELVDPNGGSWQWTRDEYGRAVARRSPDGATVHLRWRGPLLEAIADGVGATTGFEYDAAHNLVALHLADGGSLRWSYDRLGRARSFTTATGAVLTLVRDRLGRVIERGEADGTLRRTRLDGEGRPLRIELPDRVIELAWAGLEQLRLRREAGVETRFDYDSEERLTELINAHGDRYRFERDARGEVVAEIGWAGDRRELVRDAAGRVRQLRLPGGTVTTYAWNPNGRLSEVAYADGGFERYEYRADGLLTRVSNETCAVTFERDAIGRITREWQDEHWIESRYDLAGERVALRSSFGVELEIERDPMGRWSKLALDDGRNSTWRSDVRRDAGGAMLERAAPGEARERWTYDGLGRPAQHHVEASSGLVRDLRYGWGFDVRLARVVDALTGLGTEYEHDVLGQLRAVHHQDSADLRVADALGNIYRSLERDDRGYGPDGRLLWADAESGRIHYEYDADGRRVVRRDCDGSEWRYSWNAAGRLVAIERPDGELVEFTYDALGRRVSKSFRGRTTRWLWDGDVMFHEWDEVEVSEPTDLPLGSQTLALDDAEREAPRARGPPPGLITWVSDPDTLAPAAKLVGGRAYTIVCDHIGTPTLMLDEHGRRVWQAEISAWGELRVILGDAADCPHRFAGQYEDRETGLFYNRYRYFEPGAGQYLCVDPIRLAGGLNSFAYVGDPLSEADPLGLATCRGRIQAQGGGTEKSVPWTKDTPPTVSEGLDMLDSLKSQLTKPEFKARKELIEKAQKWITKAGENGGVSAPVSKTFKAKGPTDIRIDIEIITGDAFVPG
ncbi:RHS domain-containing protein [Pseudenhygromyxa sp. WMMC2535]|uniref:DUF6531 domain-containing protein n=1 Tax=Pseudenhygromyxa sp. WMMC2535 TaxID=2712867 RepID=UPI0015951156|nr:DUF6531 domain-containing protein [Pseudenhygromyxa sp. WMMC2535]NVB42049.1 RHS domain-containing protein [Pseudenhygromyxa sp. WMMC2535]